MFVGACARGENQSAYSHLGYARTACLSGNIIDSATSLWGKVEDGEVVSYSFLAFSRFKQYTNWWSQQSATSALTSATHGGFASTSLPLRMLPINARGLFLSRGVNYTNAITWSCFFHPRRQLASSDSTRSFHQPTTRIHQVRRNKRRHKTISGKESIEYHFTWKPRSRAGHAWI